MRKTMGLATFSRVQVCCTCVSLVFPIVPKSSNQATMTAISSFQVSIINVTTFIADPRDCREIDSVRTDVETGCSQGRLHVVGCRKSEAMLCSLPIGPALSPAASRFKMCSKQKVCLRWDGNKQRFVFSSTGDRHSKHRHYMSSSAWFERPNC